MTALAEALLAAQRQAVGVVAKAFVAGHIDTEELAKNLDAIGLRDELYDYVFPPWRWLKWWRLHREVKRRNARVQAWLDERARA